MTDQLREELRWAREAESAIEQRMNGNVLIVSVHRQRFPPQFRRFLDFNPEQIQDHISRLESDLSDYEGGFL